MAPHGQNHGALDEIGQLADIAREGIAPKRGLGAGGETHRPSPHGLARPLEKGLGRAPADY